MISKTAEYALRVAVVLQRHSGKGPLLGKDIAERTEVPSAYLGTILHRLGHAGLVTGERGPGGGYRLKLPGSELTARQIVSVFDDIDAQRHCVLGHAICGGNTACPVHDMWAEVLSAYDRFLNEMTLDRLASIHSITLPRRKRPAKSAAGRKRSKAKKPVNKLKV